jgi:hypothetical protein
MESTDECECDREMKDMKENIEKCDTRWGTARNKKHDKRQLRGV